MRSHGDAPSSARPVGVHGGAHVKTLEWDPKPPREPKKILSEEANVAVADASEKIEKAAGNVIEAMQGKIDEVFGPGATRMDGFEPDPAVQEAIIEYVIGFQPCTLMDILDELRRRDIYSPDFIRNTVELQIAGVLTSKLDGDERVYSFSKHRQDTVDALVFDAIVDNEPCTKAKLKYALKGKRINDPQIRDAIAALIDQGEIEQLPGKGQARYVVSDENVPPTGDEPVKELSKDEIDSALAEVHETMSQPPGIENLPGKLRILRGLAEGVQNDLIRQGLREVTDDLERLGGPA